MTIEAIKAIQMVYANTTKHDWPDDIWDAICQAIKVEKHEVSQEPVACQHKRYSIDVTEQIGTCIDCGSEGRMRFVVDDTHPQPKREWIGLTPEEVVAALPGYRLIDALDIYHIIDAKLKEKHMSVEMFGFTNQQPKQKLFTTRDFIDWYDSAIWGNEDFKECCQIAFEAGWQAAQGIDEENI